MENLIEDREVGRTASQVLTGSSAATRTNWQRRRTGEPCVNGQFDAWLHTKLHCCCWESAGRKADWREACATAVILRHDCSFLDHPLALSRES